MTDLANQSRLVVFISHAEEDRAPATAICDHLEARGIGCWLAPRDVTAGADYADAIIRAIDRASAIVLVLSENANASVFVRREIERAVSKGKAVLPVRVRDVQPTGALELFVSSAQWIDAWKPPIEQHLDRLAVAVQALATGTPPPPIPHVPPVRSRRRWLVASGVLVALLVALAIGLWTRAPSGGDPKTPELAARGFLAAIDADQLDQAIDRWMSARAAALTPRPQLLYGLGQMRAFQGSPVADRNLVTRFVSVNLPLIGLSGPLELMRFRGQAPGGPVQEDLWLETTSTGSYRVGFYWRSRAPRELTPTERDAVIQAADRFFAALDDKRYDAIYEEQFCTFARNGASRETGVNMLRTLRESAGATTTDRTWDHVLPTTMIYPLVREGIFAQTRSRALHGAQLTAEDVWFENEGARGWKVAAFWMAPAILQ